MRVVVVMGGGVDLWLRVNNTTAPRRARLSLSWNATGHSARKTTTLSLNLSELISHTSSSKICSDWEKVDEDTVALSGNTSENDKRE